MNEISAVKPYPPQVFASYGNGWRQLWKHFLPLLLIGIIYIAITVAISIPQYVGQFSMMDNEVAFGVFSAVWSVISIAFGIFIGGPLGYGQYYAYLKAAKGQEVQVGDMFAGFRNYGSAVGANLLVGLIVGVGVIFLIVPGIYFACKLAFVPYLVVDRKLRVGEAFRESWRMASQGRAWKVFLLGLLAIPIVIAGLIVIGVGVIISIMWISAALASLYHAIEVSRRPQPVPEPPPYNP
jgi:membrane-anchored glycerophosphoryl diester phosphodiesterase (GDPDase)